MNLLIKRPVLFALLLLSLFSCDDANDLGTSFEGNPITAIYTDTVSITAATVLANDSIVGYQKGNLLAGTFTNNKFGITTAKSYLEIGPNGSSFAVNNGPDSVVLVLDYDEYYGDTTQNYTVQVHELTKAFEADKTYYTTNNNALTFTAATLGAATFTPAPKRTNAKTLASGTVQKTSIPIRIKLNQELGQRIMSLPTATLSNVTEFAKTFKGIVLTPGPNTNAALGFNPDADSTYLRIYYTSEGSKKTYDLAINSKNNRLNEISSTRTGTPLATLNKAGDSIAALVTGNETYLQESTGIVTKISFPYLNKLKERLDNNDIAINRAELIIPVKTNNSSVPAPFAYLLPTNKNNRILKTSGLSPRIIPADPIDRASSTTGGIAPAAIRYDKDKKAYLANVTQYIQSLIYNKQSLTIEGTSYPISKSLLLVPSSGSGILEASGLNQSILQIGGTDQIKLRIYFSKVN